MAKGQIAKTNVENLIKEAFGDNFLGLYDKKLYVQADENGEMVQVAITLTCPKNPIIVGERQNERGQLAEIPRTTEISDEERKNIADLMEKLGL